jgi:hypothetical protein
MMRAATFPVLAALLVPVVLARAATEPALHLYLQTNLAVDKTVDDAERLLQRASKAGYSAVLLADFKFGKLGDMGPNYFRNIERFKRAAVDTKIEVIPAVFPIGYSEGLLYHDPNLAEALPVRDALFVVKGGIARVQADPPVSLPGGDMSDLRKWSFRDDNLTADAGATLARDTKGNARLTQKIRVSPFRQYHVSVRVKTQDFAGEPEIKAIAGGRVLCFSHLGTKRTQDWTEHHTVFNSLEHTEVTLYLGVWGGAKGSLWWDDAKIEETALVNLVRRAGAPLVVKREGGAALVEGKDFERVTDPRSGTVPWSGGFEVWHEPPVIKTPLPDGTRLRVSFYHAITIHHGQVMICPSEPKTDSLLRDQARRVHAAWGAKGYMMSHDEIRVLNWCKACQDRGLDAGELLADNARTCVRILKETNPGGRIHVWSDMFDPHHNAKNNYYLVRGDLKGSWDGLDRDVVMVNWNFGGRRDSLKWFESRGHPQTLAGYYDGPPRQIRDWLDAARGLKGIEGAVFTTWRNNYADLEAFAEAARGK